MLEQITDATFEQNVLKSPTPVLVDFYADWCQPCQMLGPILEEVAQDLKGKLKIVKMNIDDNPNTPSSFGVMSIPTIILFKGGQQLAVQVGVHAKSKLVDWVEKSLAA